MIVKQNFIQFCWLGKGKRKYIPYTITCDDDPQGSLLAQATVCSPSQYVPSSPGDEILTSPSSTYFRKFSADLLGYCLACSA